MTFDRFVVVDWTTGICINYARHCEFNTLLIGDDGTVLERMHGRLILLPVQESHSKYSHVVDLSLARRPVYRLVAHAFLGRRPAGLVTRHLNDVKSDNRLQNLVYGTHKENGEDRVRNECMKLKDKYRVFSARLRTLIVRLSECDNGAQTVVASRDLKQCVRQLCKWHKQELRHRPAKDQMRERDERYTTAVKGVLPREWTETNGVVYKEDPLNPGYFVGSDGSAWTGWTSRDPRHKKAVNELIQIPTRRRGQHGHPIVDLDMGKSLALCRMVMRVFRGSTPNGLVICQLDDDKTNCALSNLKWMTRKDSAKHKKAVRKLKEAMAHGQAR
jgi:hypothetical protein